MATRSYLDTAPAVKTTDPGPPDCLLLKLGADGRAEVLFLTTPSAATRRRLRRFARLLMESPSFPAFGGDGAAA